MAVQILGSINIDIIASVEALPRAGETVLARRVVRMAGGKGANQAVAAARMGASAMMIGAVGDDEAGRWMLSSLAEAGVDLTGVETIAGEATGAAYIAVDAHAENQIVVAPGANAQFGADRVQPPAPGTRILLAQLELPVETVAAFFAAPRGAIHILNAAPAVEAARALFPATDILIVNQHELARYLGLSDPPIASAVPASARSLLSRPDQVVVVTLGAAGAIAVRAEGHVHAPALPVTPLDTIGAGDCFCGALAALLDEGYSVEQALPLANAAAALCTLSAGAVPAMPDRAAAERALCEGAT